MKDSTLLLLGGAGVLYLLSRNSSSGASAPVASYGSPFSQPTNGARTAGSAANSLAQQQASASNPFGSILSSLGSVLSGIAGGRSGGGGGGIGGASVGGGGGSSSAASSFNADTSSGQTVFGDNVSGNVFDTAGGSSLSMTNSDFGGLGFDTSGVDTSGNSNDNSNSLDYTGAGDFSGYSDIPATGN